MSLFEVALALGAEPVKVPAAAATLASEVIKRLPKVPSDLERLHIAQTSGEMDATKALDVLGGPQGIWRSSRSTRSMPLPADAIFVPLCTLRGNIALDAHCRGRTLVRDAGSEPTRPGNSHK